MGGGGGGRAPWIACPCASTHKDQGDHQPLPEQWMLMRWGPHQCEATCVLHNLLYQVINSCSEQSHKDGVRKSSCWGTIQLQGNPSIYESPAPPASSDLLLSLPMAMHISWFFVFVVGGVFWGWWWWGAMQSTTKSVRKFKCNTCFVHELMECFIITLATTKHNLFLFFQRWILTLLTTQLLNHCFQQDLRARSKKVSYCFVFGLTSW